MNMDSTRTIKAGPFEIGGGRPFVLIAGPCVIESEELAMKTAESLKKITGRLGLTWIFKSSYDKANRSSIDSFRGPGMDDGLKILAKVKSELDVPVLTDVHSVGEVATVSEVADVIQIPAFLCRQTDILVEAGKCGRPVNIKKGQFMAPSDMVKAAAKVERAGGKDVFITERGTTFGYNNLVVDMRSLAIIREAGLPVVFDATHSVQLPGAEGECSGGDRKYVPLLARAAVAAGVDGLFMEVHPDPDSALCDGPNSWPLSDTEPLLKTLIELDRTIKKS